MEIEDKEQVDASGPCSVVALNDISVCVDNW